MEDKMSRKRCREPDCNDTVQNKIMCKQLGSNSSLENLYAIQELESSNESYCSLFDFDITEQAVKEDRVSELMRHLKEEIEMPDESHCNGQSLVESNDDVQSKLWDIGFPSMSQEMEDPCMGMGMGLGVDSFAMQSEFTDFILLLENPVKEMTFMSSGYYNDTTALLSQDWSYKLDMMSDKFCLSGDELWQFDDEIKWTDTQGEGAELLQICGKSDIPDLSSDISEDHPQA